MKRLWIFAVVIGGTCTGACVDNEISFFIEHAKAQPEAPNCVWSPSDDFQTTGLIDLAFSNEYRQGFLVQNQLMSREDYDNLKAETNGIFVEGTEVEVRMAPNEAIGGTQRSDIEIYVEPESVGIIPITVLSASIVEELAAQVNCLVLTPENYPEESVYRSGTDVNGAPRSRDVGYASARVKFLGHTNGGVDVKTPEFTFGIQLCCGCLVNWSNCSEYCERYCEQPEEDKMCYTGVANGGNYWDCRKLYANPNASWEDPSNESCEDEGDDGEVVRRSCTCADCAG